MVGGSNPPSATNSDPLDSLASAVARGARRLRIPVDADLVLAVSGGPDSLALLHGAVRLVATDGTLRWRLSVAHLDHALRPGSADDARFVVETADALGVPVEVRRADVAALARDEGRSLEDAGRHARYRFFAELAGDGGLIATAHTLDDSAETVLLNLVRGSGLSGLRGIPARRGNVVRPLIDERRGELRAALDAAGVRYLLDETNDELRAARNRVRHELLPRIERLNPAGIEAIARYARLAADDDELLHQLAATELARRLVEGEIDWHDPPPRALGRRVLRLAIGQPPPSAERVEALLEAAEGPRGGLSVELGGGRVASVHGRRVRLE